MDGIAYNIRNGPGNLKTKIMFGYDDLVLYKKVPDDISWNVVPLEGLPAVDLAPPQPQTNSPPPGRPRLLKRKERSPLQNSSEKSSKSHRFRSPGEDDKPKKVISGSSLLDDVGKKKVGDEKKKEDVAEKKDDASNESLN